MPPQRSTTATRSQPAPPSCGIDARARAPHTAIPVDSKGQTQHYETTRPDAEGLCQTCSGPIVFDEFWGWLHASAPTGDPLQALADRLASPGGQTR
jgi:hypothetical protein